MTDAEESYVHFCECIDNLNLAWRVFQELRTQKTTPLLTHAAFRFAVVEYCKPFRKSRGTLKGRTHDLRDAGHTPTEYLPLHQRLLDARDQTLAHQDLTVLAPRIDVADTPAGRIAGYSRNTVSGSEEYAHLDVIIAMVEATLDGMYAERDKRERELPANARLGRGGSL